VLYLAKESELNGYSLTWLLETNDLSDIGISDVLVQARVRGHLEKLKDEQDRALELWQKQEALDWSLRQAHLSEEEGVMQSSPCEWLAGFAMATDSLSEPPPGLCEGAMAILLPEDAWQCLQLALELSEESVVAINALCDKRNHLLQAKALEKRVFTQNEHAHQFRKRSPMGRDNERMEELNQELWNSVLQVTWRDDDSFGRALECALHHAPLLCCHCVGSLFMTLFFLKGDSTQRQCLVDVLAAHADCLAKDR